MPKRLLNSLTPIRRLGLGLVISLLVLFYPAAVFAASADTTGPTTTGPTSPTGADSSTYHLNEATGNWENDYYIWNPATGQTTPKTAAAYTYDGGSNTWGTQQWQYDAAAGKYNAVPVNVANPPAGSQTIGGPSSSNGSNTTNTGLNNTIGSNAVTGDASVSGNTSAGSATSGNASASANVINMLQSALSGIGSSSGVVTFLADIPGSVTGNLMVDPASIAQNQGSNQQLQAAQAVTVNNTNDGSIDNAIVLNASSGNAGVVANTSAGSATSGNATAVANVVNAMNSSVGAGQSFVGVINVQGDLTGDILFPTGFFDSLIANGAPDSTNSTSNTGNVTANTTNVNNQSINNNLSANAGTGTADVSHNTTAGSGTSGNALTQLTVMNLTGSDIIGSNALLVFINVGGNWQGIIMNAPSGSKSALLGGGISQNTSNDFSGLATVNNTNNQSINNDISVGAQSGNATVNDNTLAGNATSGNATATINLANLINDHINLSSWFGVLFINVLGNWNGNFGTAPPAASTQAGGSSGSVGGSVFSFFGTTGQPTGATTLTTGVGFGTGQASSGGGSDQNPQVLATTNEGTGTPPAAFAGKASAADSASSHHYNFWVPAVGFSLALLLLGADKFRPFSKRLAH